MNSVDQTLTEALYFAEMDDAAKDEVLEWVKTGTIPKGKFNE